MAALSPDSRLAAALSRSRTWKRSFCAVMTSTTAARDSSGSFKRSRIAAGDRLREPASAQATAETTRGLSSARPAATLVRVRSLARPDSTSTSAIVSFLPASPIALCTSWITPGPSSTRRWISLRVSGRAGSPSVRSSVSRRSPRKVENIATGATSSFVQGVQPENRPTGAVKALASPNHGYIGRNRQVFTQYATGGAGPCQAGGRQLDCAPLPRARHDPDRDPRRR